MTTFLEELSRRRRFGMKMGLETIREICRQMGDVQKKFHPIHVAGTNGKGAVAAILDACLGGGRYTSPHLLRLNERFFLNGQPLDDATLERAAERVRPFASDGTTFFEALTAVAFQVYADAQPCNVIMETGLGGRLDATNVCEPCLTVITRIGLEHCEWLGDTIERIAAEKAGIIKPGVPVVLGRNEPGVCAVIKAKAALVGAPFHYAPDLGNESEIPDGFSLQGSFNRENAITAMAALKVFTGNVSDPLSQEFSQAFSRIVWPGRYQRVDSFIIDGAHNPPAARALAEALSSDRSLANNRLNLIAGFCSDKAVREVLLTLAPFIHRAFAVKTNNPRSLSADETAAAMRAAGIEATAFASLPSAIDAARLDTSRSTLICGSLFLAGEALQLLGAYPWTTTGRIDPSELLNPLK